MTPSTAPSRRPPRGRARFRGLVGLALLLVLGAACSGDSSRAASDTGAGASSRAQVATRPTAVESSLVAARPYEVHVPPGYGKKPAPLLILLHGFSVDGAMQEAYFKLTPVADEHGMLYVHLDGTVNVVGARFWNATDACCDPRDHVDDAAYISAVITDVKSRYHVDPGRVFLVGHSNGGFMAYRMACDHADEIAAIVSVAGATWADPSRCKPSEPVATLEIHGTADRTIYYDGGTILSAHYPSVEQTVAAWARYDGCRKRQARPVPAGVAIVKRLPRATVRAFTDCDRNGHVELWTQPRGVHIPPLRADFAERVVRFLLAHPKR